MADVKDDGSFSSINLKYDESNNSIGVSVEDIANIFAYTPDGYIVRVTDDVSEDNPDGSVMGILTDIPDGGENIYILNFKGTYEVGSLRGLNDYICFMLYTSDYLMLADGTYTHKANFAVLDRNNRLKVDRFTKSSYKKPFRKGGFFRAFFCPASVF